MSDYFQRMARHIAKLSKTPGWGAYTRHWAKDLEQDKSGAYAGIVQAVRELLKSSNEQKENGD